MPSSLLLPLHEYYFCCRRDNNWQLSVARQFYNQLKTTQQWQRRKFQRPREVVHFVDSFIQNPIKIDKIYFQIMRIVLSHEVIHSPCARKRCDNIDLSVCILTFKCTQAFRVCAGPALLASMCGDREWAAVDRVHNKMYFGVTQREHSHTLVCVSAEKWIWQATVAMGLWRVAENVAKFVSSVMSSWTKISGMENTDRHKRVCGHAQCASPSVSHSSYCVSSDGEAVPPVMIFMQMRIATERRDIIDFFFFLVRFDFILSSGCQATCTVINQNGRRRPL